MNDLGFLNPFLTNAPSWFPMLTLTVLKVTVVFGAILAILALTRSAPASFRHLLLVLGFGASLAIPAFALTLPKWRAIPAQSPIVSPWLAETDYKPLIPGRTQQSAGPVAPTVSNDMSPVTGSAQSEPGLALPARSQPFPGNIAIWLLSIWGLGFVFFSVRLSRGLLEVYGSIKRATPVTDPKWKALLAESKEALSIHVNVSLMESERERMPRVWGINRYFILLPKGSEKWALERKRAVLLHELAHVSRHDCITLLIARLACALNWLNPLAWVLLRKLNNERERACDDLALGEGLDRDDYADQVLKLAADSGPRRGFAPVMAARTELEGRLMAIIDKTRKRTPVSIGLKGFTVALFVVITLPLATIATSEDSGSRADPSESDVSFGDASDTDVAFGDPSGADVSHSDVALFQQDLSQDPSIAGRTHDAEALIPRLGDPSALKRASSAWALGETGDPRAVEPLIESLEDENAMVREWSARTLGSIGDDRAVDALIRRVSDESPAVREWSIRALSKIGNPRAAESITKALDDPDPDVREWAARSLGTLQDPGSVDALIELLGDENPDVRQGSLRALGKIADPRSNAAIIQTLKDPDPEIREWAARALGAIGSSQSVDPLLATLSDENPEVREWIVRALGEIGDPRATESIIGMLKDENEYVRYWAARALGNIKTGGEE